MRRAQVKRITLFMAPSQSSGRVFTIWPAKREADGDWAPGGNWRATESPFLIYDVTNPNAWQRVGLGATRRAALHIESRFRRTVGR